MITCLLDKLKYLKLKTYFVTIIIFSSIPNKLIIIFSNNIKHTPSSSSWQANNVCQFQEQLISQMLTSLEGKIKELFSTLDAQQNGMQELNKELTYL